MAWVVKGEEAGVTDYYFDKLSGRHKIVIGEFAAMFDDPLYHFENEQEAEMISRNVYYDQEEMNPCEAEDHAQIFIIDDRIFALWIMVIVFYTIG